MHVLVKGSLNQDFVDDDEINNPEMRCFVVALMLAREYMPHRVLNRKYDLMEQFEVSKILFIKAAKHQVQLIAVAWVHEPFPSLLCP